jgi:hypothetical protein
VAVNLARSVPACEARWRSDALGQLLSDSSTRLSAAAARRATSAGSCVLKALKTRPSGSGLEKPSSSKPTSAARKLGESATTNHAREPHVAAQADDAEVRVARRLPVRLAEDVNALGHVGDPHVAVNDRLHVRQALEAGVEATAAVRPQEQSVLDHQAEVFEAGNRRAEAEGRALLEVAARDERDRTQVFDTLARGSEGLVEHGKLFHGRIGVAVCVGGRHAICINSNLRRCREFLMKVWRKQTAISFSLCPSVNTSVTFVVK